MVARIEGQEVRHRGPFATAAEADADQFAMLQLWVRAARRRGGWLSVLTKQRWLVTLPRELPCRGLPFQPEAMSRAAASVHQ